MLGINSPLLRRNLPGYRGVPPHLPRPVPDARLPAVRHTRRTAWRRTVQVEPAGSDERQG